MVARVIAFPVDRGIRGMNALAAFLNASDLAGAWHFGMRTRFDQPMVNIEFDDPTDAEPTLRRYGDRGQAVAAGIKPLPVPERP